MDTSVNGAKRMRWRVSLRRGLFFGLTFLTAAGASALLLDVLEANGISAIEVLGLVLFFCLFTWIAGSLPRSPTMSTG